MTVSGKSFLAYPSGTAEYVVAHRRYSKGRGRGPSATFHGVSNPRLALEIAKNIIGDKPPISMVLNDGKRVWVSFHIEDMASQYAMGLKKLGEAVLSGKMQMQEGNSLLVMSVRVRSDNFEISDEHKRFIQDKLVQAIAEIAEKGRGLATHLKIVSRAINNQKDEVIFFVHVVQSQQLKADMVSGMVSLRSMAREELNVVRKMQEHFQKNQTGN